MCEATLTLLKLKRKKKQRAERKKRLREEREHDAKEKSWRLKLNQGRTAGRRVGASDHGDQFT